MQVCNKQGNQIEKIYLFEEDEAPKIFHLEDDKKITSLNKTQLLMDYNKSPMNITNIKRNLPKIMTITSSQYLNQLKQLQLQLQ